MQLIQAFPEVLHIVDDPNYVLGEKSYLNTNWMLSEINKHEVGFEGVDGLKTGYTDEAGFCFAGTVKKDGRRFISVVMGTTSEIMRFSETKRLYEAAFN